MVFLPTRTQRGREKEKERDELALFIIFGNRVENDKKPTQKIANTWITGGFFFLGVKRVRLADR
jgi:hypothetical protein